MEKKTKAQFEQEIQLVLDKLPIGTQVFHYKHPDQYYTITDVIILESTREVGIVYRVDYEELLGVKFVRTEEDFFGQVEVEGKLVPRFTIVS